MLELNLALDDCNVSAWKRRAAPRLDWFPVGYTLARTSSLAGAASKFAVEFEDRIMMRWSHYIPISENRTESDQPIAN